ncbi:MAG: hypothetical protein RJA70_1948 [Pseudomonadota bacterium]|jgi:tellurite resistance protein TerC
MNLWIWISFLALVFVLLALDLGVFHRSPRAMSSKEALKWTGIWVLVSMAFTIPVYGIYEYDWLAGGASAGKTLGGATAVTQFLTAYVVEKSLSLDNVFVMAVIFGYFKIPGQYQHRVLFYGILGALILRGLMIGFGLAAVSRFGWVMYIFGAILIFTAGKLLFAGESDFEPDKSFALRLVKRFFPITQEVGDGRFFLILNGVRHVTPLGLALVVVEATDVVFAVDSIPAVFAVTLDPFLVFTSNVFAILGLRSLYFALAAMLGQFRFLKYSLVFILAFVGVKMLLAHSFKIPAGVSLSLLVAALAAGIFASRIWPEKHEGAGETPLL